MAISNDTPAVRLVDIPPSTSVQQEDSFEQPTEAPVQPGENLFAEEDDDNYFAEIEEGIATPNSNIPTPVRSMVAAVAQVGTDRDITNNLDVMQSLEANLQSVNEVIRMGRESELRDAAAIRRTINRDRALRAARPADPIIDPELTRDINLALEENRRVELEEAAKTALEHEAVDRIQDYLATGRDVEARALLNQFDPARGTTVDVIRDFTVKRMILAQHLERADIDVDREGWIPWILSTVLSLPEAVLAGETFWRLGNVPEGVGGYVPTWFRFFNPGSEMARQIESVQGMTAAELQDALPQLIEEWKNNATIFGLDDPGRFREIVRQFNESITPEEQTMANVMSNIDAISLVPFVTGYRMMTGSFTLTRLGARSVAAGRVADAVEIMTREGAEATAERTGVTIDEIVDSTLPTAVNPLRTPGQAPMVSLSGQVNDRLQIVRDAIAQLSTRTADEFPGRFFNRDEWMEAVEATVRDLEARTGMQLVDWRPVVTQLEDGTAVSRVEGYIGPFATDAEATRWASTNGIYSDPSQIMLREAYGPQRPARAIQDKEPWERPAREDSRSKAVSAPTVRNPYHFIEDGNEVVIHANDEVSITPARRDELEAVFHDDVRDLELTEGRALTGEEKDKLWDEILEGENVAEVDRVMAGITDAVSNPNNIQMRLAFPEMDYAKAANDVDVVEDISGQFFVRAEMDVAETGFYTPILNPPRTGALGRHLKNTSQTMDQRLFEMAREAGDIQNKYLKVFQHNWLKAFRALSGRDRVYLSEILKRGDALERWFTDEELATLWERSAGKPITDKVTFAYKQFIINNDAEYIMRNANVYKGRVIRGEEEVHFVLPDGPKMVNAIVRDNPSGAVKDRVYNITDDKHYTSQLDPLTGDMVERLKAQGYIMFEATEPVRLNSGHVVKQFIARKSDLEIRPLNRIQLGYRAGGHRLYADKWFGKQARVGIQPDTGSEFALNPNVYITAPTRKLAKEWVETMERARLAVKDGGADAGELDATIFQSRKGYPSGQQFIDDIEEGNISLDHPFEAVFDREMPSFYREKVDLENFIDEDEVGFNGFYRTNNRLYTGPKGEKLRSYDGTEAPVLDPFESQSRALFNISNMTSFSDFKTSAIDRWARQYAHDLNTAGLNSPVEIFNSATVKEGTDYITRNQIEAQRDSIKRILNFQTPFERSYNHWLRNTGDWIGDYSTTGARLAYGLMHKNPVSFLRTFAFDLKLGLFNLGQFLIQTSTMWSAMALSPRLGVKGMGSVMPVWTYFLSKGSENVLDTLVKRGAHKLAGFDDVNEFKEYVRWARHNGFFDIGDTHAQVNAQGPATTFSAFGNLQSVRETGRMFFYQAEVWNRLVSTRIAYGEAVERFGRINFNDPEIRRFIRGRAENYSMNMSQESRSWWQSGLLSVPTQFWAYNARMIEALLGNNFTTAQKIRLLLANLTMAGAAGVPIVAGVSDMVNAHYGEAPPIDSMLGTLQRGVFDRMIFEIAGADVQLSEKWGTGSWSTDVIRDMFGYSRYQDKTFAQMIGGATYSILGQTLQMPIEFAAMWTSAESGSEPINMNGEQITEFLRNIATINNAMKARMAYQAGILENTKGYPQLEADFNLTEAVFIALGIPPGETADVEALSAHNENYQNSVNEVANEANNLLREAVARPDLREENRQKVNLLISLVPPDMKRDVLERIHQSRDSTIYNRLLRQREERELVKEMREAVGATE